MDTWEPDLYNRFARERRLPFDELVDLCEPVGAGGLVYDLGCGPGNLTVDLKQRLGASTAIGVDNSDAMLTKADASAGDGVSFEKGDLATFTAAPAANLIFSNAALHWVPNHGEVLARWRSQLVEGGQLAVQIPCNDDHPAYPLATRVANEHPEWFPSGAPPLATASVLAPEQYATILHGLGATTQHVMLRVYVHEMPSAVNVADWLQSTTLNPFKLVAANPEAFDQFMAAYRSRLPAALDAQSQGQLAQQAEPAQLSALPQQTASEPGKQERPAAEAGPSSYPFTFKRILMWARFN